MDDLSLAHSRYNCTYHILFIPKYRRKVMFGALRREVGEILGKVCKMEEITIIKAATLPDHVHMLSLHFLWKRNSRDRLQRMNDSIILRVE